MIKKIFIYCICYFILCYCISQSDEKYIRHWSNKPNSCVHFFNDDNFVGLLLDGNILKETDLYLLNKIKRITNVVSDSLQYFVIDTLEILNFEKYIYCLFKENDSLSSMISNLRTEFYVRQYLGFRYENSNYLFACFMLDRLNLRSENNSYYYVDNKSYFEYKLVYSRLLFSHGLDSWKRTNNLFYVLYNFDLNYIIFYFFCNSIDCESQILIQKSN